MAGSRARQSCDHYGRRVKEQFRGTGGRRRPDHCGREDHPGRAVHFSSRRPRANCEGKRHRKKAAPDYQTAKLIYREIKDIRMTIRYAHLSPEHLSDAMKELDLPLAAAEKIETQAG